VNGIDTPLEVDEYVWAIGAQSSPVRLIVKPKLGDDSGTKWDLFLDSTLEIHDLTLGIVLPSGTLPSQARVVGCASNATDVNPVYCNPTTALSSKIDALRSFTAGPGLGPEPRRPDALYLRVVGNQFPALGTEDVMNRANIAEKLATVEIDTTNFNPPPIVLEGASVVSPSGSAIVESFLDEVPTDDVALTQAGGLLRDLDGDGIVDESDSCIYAYDPNDIDRGGPPPNPQNPDGVGDVCQCGDTHGPSVLADDGGGRVDNADVMRLQQALTGALEDHEVRLKGSVSGDSGFDIKDAVVLQLATDGGATPANPSIGAVCTRAVSVFSGDSQ
jgi:hypothetical protein